jgi:hypothetical protein
MAVRTPPPLAPQPRSWGQAIFLPRVRGTAIGSCWKQYLPLLYIESLVLHPGWRQVRPLPNAFDALSPPLRLCPPSDRSLMTLTNVRLD